MLPASSTVLLRRAAASKKGLCSSTANDDAVFLGADTIPLHWRMTARFLNANGSIRRLLLAARKCRGQHPSKASESPGTRFELSLYQMTTREPFPVEDRRERPGPRWPRDRGVR